MLVKKKDWQNLLARLEKTESRKNEWTTAWFNEYGGRISKLDQRLHELESKHSNVRKDYEELRSLICNFFGGVKSVCEQASIYTVDEINNMSADEYKNKVLTPLIKRRNQVA